MNPTVGDVMAAVRNYFPRDHKDGTWTINGHALAPEDGLLTGDWIAVSGSKHNNGVWCLGAGAVLTGSTDEQFEGRVWLLAPPPAFLALCGEIAAWCETHPRDDTRRESFGGYTRETAVDACGVPMGWQHVFGAELTPWRRMYTGVKL